MVLRSLIAPFFICVIIPLRRNTMKDYYKAYDERYKEVHKRNLLWEYDDPTKEISDIINKYN